MIIKQIKLSNQSKDRLSRLKGKTGIKNWNVLCRWALCYSLGENTMPTDIPMASDSNVEMSWYTFAGEYSELYEVFFTSGATESNNIALQGLKEYAELTGKKHIITSSIEHKAVLETTKHLQQLGFEVDYVDPERDGRILPEKVFGLLRKDTLLVSIMHVNNETGAVQPVQEVGDYLLDKDVFFHVDATQSFGKLVDELRFLKYDMLSMSAHKLGGPQGIGALILRKKRYKLPPVKNIMYGGPQEHGIRPGTTPVALVAGLGKACELAATEYKKNAERCCAIRNCILQLLKESGTSYRINGDLQYCIHNTLNMCFDGVSSEALMLATKQYCGISNGSACNSHSYSPSYVLTAMGLPEERIESSIRVSWGPLTDIQLVEIEFGKMLSYVKSMQ